MRHSQKWLRSWAALALFAVLALFTSPAFAFTCCCHSMSVAAAQGEQRVSSHSASIVTDSSIPSCCRERGEKGTPQIHASHKPCHGKASQTATLGGVCHCGQSDLPVFASVAPSDWSAFAAFVLRAPSQTVSFDLTSASSLPFAFASSAARPRSPSAAYCTGRAPPAFS